MICKNKTFSRLFLIVLLGFSTLTLLQADDSKAADEFNPKATAFHHIADANIFSIGPWSFPLPCILYAPDSGWSFFSSSKFHVSGHHGDGTKIVDGYVLRGGRVNRIADTAFPTGEFDLTPSDHGHSTSDDHGHAASEEHGHSPFSMMEITTADGEHKEIDAVTYDGKVYPLDKPSTADGGLFGGGVTSFYDYSITKNVFAMILVSLFLLWLFTKIARDYKNREGQAPSGVQGFIEPIFVFIQDEVAKPFLGKQWERFLPFLMSLFFFILTLNLFGQIPFLGGANVTGSLGFTMVLAIIVFIVTNINGNKHYWEHTLWMPGVPTVLKILILTPVEILGLFIKPLTLMLRLFANITAGHMVVVIFVGLIFLFGGTTGANPGASYTTAIGSTLLTLFMMAIELLVALIQAFVFTILTASYIGAATEEAHH